MVDQDGFIILERTYSQLFEKVNYIAPVDYCINRIYEYDIRMANVSMLRDRKYLPADILDTLSNQPKALRERIVGLIIRSQKEKYGESKVNKIIKTGIIRAKDRLFRENDVQDSEVLSIKNDAVFIIGRKLRKTKFGNVEFVLKNSFSAYHMINGIEFYYVGKDREFVIKGISDDIVNHSDHKNGMLKFLDQVMQYLLYDRKDDLRKYLIRFSDQYKSRKLPHQYYRELNSHNIYRDRSQLSYKVGEKTQDIFFNYDDVNDDMIKDLNITFNYTFYVLTLIRLHL